MWSHILHRLRRLRRRTNKLTKPNQQTKKTQYGIKIICRTTRYPKINWALLAMCVCVCGQKIYVLILLCDILQFFIGWFLPLFYDGGGYGYDIETFTYRQPFHEIALSSSNQSECSLDTLLFTCLSAGLYSFVRLLACSCRFFVFDLVYLFQDNFLVYPICNKSPYSQSGTFSNDDWKRMKTRKSRMQTRK